jgi:type II secretory pathway pseudopilin PulG
MLFNNNSIIKKMSILHPRHVASRKGFSLIEVVLAIGIFLVTVLALVGLLGPTLKSVDEVEKTDEVSSIVNTINAFLQNSQDIAPGDSRFDAILAAVATGGHATLLVFRAYDNNDVISLKIGFVGETDVSARISAADVTDGSRVFAAGTIYRAVLSASSVMPLDYHQSTTTDSDGKVIPKRDSNEIYKLHIKYAGFVAYPEGSLALEVRIFAEDPSLAFDDASDLVALKDQEPIFTYNTAIVR